MNLWKWKQYARSGLCKKWDFDFPHPVTGMCCHLWSSEKGRTEWLKRYKEFLQEEIKYVDEELSREEEK